MSFDTVPPPAHPGITPELVQRLLARHLPHYAHLSIGERTDGWDAAMFRLGERLAVRVPRTAHAVQFLRAETTWLPRLSGGWDFPVPQFEAVCEPGPDFEWPWAVVTWLPGTTADAVAVRSADGPALGAALAQVHVPVGGGVPVGSAVPHNPEQSIPLAARDAKVRERIGTLAASRGPAGQTVDAAACVRLWEEAVPQHGAGVPEPSGDEFVWSHADMHGGNVLVTPGKAGVLAGVDGATGAFAGIVDWGSMAACDPAVDVGFLHLLTSADGVELALAEYHRLTGRVDEAFRVRARAIGLSKALNVALHPRPASRAMGWRGLGVLGLTRE